MSNAEVPRENVTRVELSSALVDDVEQRLQYVEFDDADAYIEFVVEEVLAAVADGDDTGYDAVDRGEVEGRLESLGYLD